MEKRKTVNVIKSQSSRGCFIFLLVPFIVTCMVIPMCIGIVTVALVVGAVEPADVMTDTFTSELGDAESAQIEIAYNTSQVNINPLTDSSDLFTADLSYIGTVDFTEGGDSVRTIRLNQVDEENNLWGIFNVFGVGDLSLIWNIGIAPDIPITLGIDGGVGEMNLNLEEFILTELNLNVGVGSVNINLPEPTNRYVVTIDGGVGDTTITLPEGVAVRLEALLGAGEVDITNNTLTRVGGDNGNSDASVDGIWETENFATADTAIVIRFDGGVGELNIR